MITNNPTGETGHRGNFYLGNAIFPDPHHPCTPRKSYQPLPCPWLPGVDGSVHGMCVLYWHAECACQMCVSFVHTKCTDMINTHP